MLVRAYAILSSQLTTSLLISPNVYTHAKVIVKFPCFPVARRIMAPASFIIHHSKSLQVMSAIYKEIGQKFVCGGQLLKCVEDDICSCRGCWFWRAQYDVCTRPKNRPFLCIETLRPDNKNVIFVPTSK